MTPRSELTFGTDGIRGRAGAWPIDEEAAARVGAAAATWGGAAAPVVIGRDPRPSGDRLAAAVAAGVRGAGGAPIDGGVVPTAAVQLAVAEGLARVGVMITASHNPAPDNGFKILGPGGRKPDDQACGTLEGWMRSPARTDGAPAAPTDGRVAGAWISALLGAAGDLEPLRGRRIAVDLANGAAAPHREALASRWPFEVVWLGTGGTVNDRCGSEHLDHLRRAVRERGCDAGFAVDGDADRCRLVDERGEEVAGDALTWLLARDLGARALAVTVMSNGALEGLLPGVRVVRTPVGDRHLRESMDREDLPLGAEESGHVLFRDHPGGDGLLTGLRALAAAARAATRVSEAVRGFVPLARGSAKVPVSARPPLESLPDLRSASARGEARLGRGGRVFLRYSGTEDLLRILVEGQESPVVEEVLAELVSAARAALGGPGGAR